MSACYAVSPGRFGSEGRLALTLTVACSWLVMLFFMHLRCVPSACRHSGDARHHGWLLCRQLRAGFAGYDASAVFPSIGGRPLFFWTGHEVAALVVDLGSFMFMACFAMADMDGSADWRVSPVDAWFSTTIDMEEVLSNTRDFHVFVVDVVKSFDTVDRDILQSSYGLN